MAEKIAGLKTTALRPVDCSEAMIDRFIELVMLDGELPIENLRRGVPASEILFFSGTEDTVMGVSAIRFANRAYHKHLFEKAGAPEMFNPWSVESCWLYILPEYRGKGIWSSNRAARLAYLGNRPCHSVARVGNTHFDPKKSIYTLAGEYFYADTSDDQLRLLVYNHDPVFDKSKRLRYQTPAGGPQDDLYHG